MRWDEVRYLQSYEYVLHSLASPVREAVPEPDPDNASFLYNPKFLFPPLDIDFGLTSTNWRSPNRLLCAA